jgi:hypothetical protein
LWSQVDLKYIVDCVIILHNMTIVYEKDMEQLHIKDCEKATLDMDLGAVLESGRCGGGSKQNDWPGEDKGNRENREAQYRKSSFTKCNAEFARAGNSAPAE